MRVSTYRTSCYLRCSLSDVCVYVCAIMRPFSHLAHFVAPNAVFVPVLFVRACDTVCLRPHLAHLMLDRDAHTPYDRGLGTPSGVWQLEQRLGMDVGTTA
jgi:hypothetical protein